MHNASIDQIVGIWSELEECYYDDNGYGGDTAEIYLYRVQHSFPSYVHSGGNYNNPLLGEDFRKFDIDAIKTLFSIFKQFEEKKEVTIEVEEFNDYKNYFVGPAVPIYRRIHVKVIKTEKQLERRNAIIKRITKEKQ